MNKTDTEDRPAGIIRTFPKAKDVVKICQVVEFWHGEVTLVTLKTVLNSNEHRFTLPLEFLPAGTSVGKHVMVICALAAG